MNKIILMIAMALMVVSMLATPVLAIGPQNAENNPNVVFPPYGVGLNLPNGMDQQWVLAIDKHLMVKDARYFQINNAFVVTDLSQVSEMENKWLFFSVPMFAQWMAAVLGISYPAAYGYVLANWPEGVYYREVLVGK
jgi:hypothetical protein